MTERYEIALNTPAGRLTTSLDVPRGFVSITAIVPAMRQLGEEAQAMEQRRHAEEGRPLSCRKGCAACCRMMVPLSPPEAFALQDYVAALPAERRARITERMAQAKSVLLSHGLWHRLRAIGETDQAPDDAVLEPINREYYALRLPCPFLEDEMCSIYEERPAACRELLVTTPAEWCQDLVRHPVEQIPVPVRIGPALSLLYGEMTQTPPRLVPLPTVLEWAQQHRREKDQSWTATELLDRALDQVWRFLSLAFHKSS